MAARRKTVPAASGKYFVYELVDPRTDTVFYVGKGTGDRPLGHQREAKAGKPGIKCDRIREILAAGCDVHIRFPQYFADEAAALRCEASTIARYGLATLTNIRPKGFLSGITELSYDCQMARALGTIIIKTDAFRIMVGERFRDGMLKHLSGLVDRRGEGWVMDAMRGRIVERAGRGA